jgi:hypothetical protein
MLSRGLPLMIEKIRKAFYGFRKVLIMLLVLLVAVIFRVEDYIDGNNFTELIKVTATAFFASNLGKGIAEAIKARLEK